MGERLCIIGGGSAYMPGIAFALVAHHDTFAESTVVLYDVDPEALDLQRRLTTGILRSRGASDITVESVADRTAAIEGASIVLTAFRPGGFEARHLDERIAIDHGIIGQETAGPGGFAMALRSVPLVLAIADEVHERAQPGAWLLNYTNPVQLVSEAVRRFGPPVPYLGLCDQTAGEQRFLGELMGVAANAIELDTAGVNHMTFTRAVRIDGVDATEAVWQRLDSATRPDVVSDGWWRVVRLFRTLRVIPSLYMQYFLCHEEVLAEMRAAGRTRAQEIMAMLPEVRASYRSQADADVPRPTMARASTEHGDFAIAIAAALRSGDTHRVILNLPNEGQVQDVPVGAIVETPATIQAGVVRAIDQGALPGEVAGLVRQVAAHAGLAAEAAVTGDRALAVRALAIHPLVRDLDAAERLVEAYVAAHARFLPAGG
ncbi:MAG: glycoside hydrolase family 4 [Actinomycetota bacterium]